METLIPVIIIIITTLISSSATVFSDTNATAAGRRADIPPRGWNSYDSFGWGITEEQFLQNSKIVSQKLLPSGYEYVVVDYLWYRRISLEGTNPNSPVLDLIDEWGRMIPDPVRWPSSKEGKGFTEIARKVHSMGLKFGIHVMRGISRHAVDANTPVLDTETGKAYVESGRVWRAGDIGVVGKSCSWMPHGFIAVNTTHGAATAFLRSLYHQYSQWGVDFVKHDCVFGDDFDLREIHAVSDILKWLDRPVVYSVSPGTNVGPEMGKKVKGLVNMYRVTGDMWDSWSDVALHFNISRDFARSGMTGGEGLLGRSWPDLDMLPLGCLTDPGSEKGPHRRGRLSADEGRSMMTLWSISQSPLFVGGDMRNLDNLTHQLLTNPTIIELNSHSSGNMEFFPQISGWFQKPISLRPIGCGEDLKAKGWPHASKLWEVAPNGTLESSHHGLCATANDVAEGMRSWVATLDKSGEICVALFNLNPKRAAISMNVSDIGKVVPARYWKGTHCGCREAWEGKEVYVRSGSLSTAIEAHGCVLLVLRCDS